MTTPADILKEALVVLDGGKRWGQGRFLSHALPVENALYGKLGSGTLIAPEHLNHCKFCAIGALRQAAVRLGQKVNYDSYTRNPFTLAQDALDKCADKIVLAAGLGVQGGTVYLNDRAGTTFDTIEAAFTCAIKETESNG
jgi:hypothetical protein